MSASKVCDKCSERFSGFGTTCSACRKISSQRGSVGVRACEVCGAFNQSYGAACTDCLAGDRDKHVSLRLRFKYPEAKKSLLPSLQAGLATCLQQKHEGALYSGCAVHDDTELLLRAGFESAAALLEFFNSLKAPFEQGVSAVGFDGFGICVVGPHVELLQLHEAMGAIGTEFYELEETSRWYNRGQPGPDAHLTLAPFFKVPKGKMEEFRALYERFYEGSRQATKERLYYGFAAVDHTVFCRQGYKNAEGVLAHLRDVDAILQEAMAIVGPEGMDLGVVGPAEELQKLRVVLGPHTPKFFELSEEAQWISN